MSAKKTSRPVTRQIVVAVLIVGALGAIAGTILLSQSSVMATTSGKVPTFEVREGPLTINVIESGTIKSQEQVILKSDVEGQTTLIYLVPEGTEVEQGTLLVELDASSLNDQKVEQEISVQNAEASFIEARESLAVVKNQAESNISAAALAFEFAKEDVAKYAEGEYPQQLREAESKITIAREEMERAAEKLKWSQRLFDEKYISQTELEADRLSHKRAELEHELAVAAKDLLVNYTNKRQMAQLQSDVEQAEMALERTKLKANADIVQAEAALKAKEASYKQQQSKLAKNEEQISKTKIYAPREGLVVYATSTQFSRRGSTEPLDEGQSVRERQELIYLPSTNEMMAEVMVHESSLEKVSVGNRVLITVDALPNRTFTGRVVSIAPLPDARSMFMNPDLKLYPTRVNLDGRIPDLRTGMSCHAEIVIEEHVQAMYVPTQAVVRVNGQATAYVREGGSFSPRAIEIGLDNNSMVHVKSGLSVGEIVSLVPPFDGGSAVGAGAGNDLNPARSESTGATSPVAAGTAGPADGPRSNNEPAEQPRSSAAPREGERGPEGQDESEEDRAARRERFRNMTPEQREAAMQERLKNMSPEERERMLERMRQRGSGERRERGERP
ncbi:MAG: efflux RND transporter periplasmic adaptor subunit [Planctomycetes bacterium]|nr:efflux RND transporter periplasmic adaptor subunit [Planctomycetota bacterium]